MLHAKLATLNRIVHQIEEQALEIHYSRELLDKLRSEVHSLRTGRGIEIKDGGRLRVGVMDFRRDNNRAQSIHNVNVSNNSQAAIGVFHDLDVNGFFEL